ncbi:MAG: hypothetical protein VX185_00380 [Pseudomonadota bacterium]|nr:hypothetical protein [Pseudomonadota bacterium]
MYTDEDLYKAVKEGVFEASAVDKFRALMAAQASTKKVDEENFRLICISSDLI